MPLQGGTTRRRIFPADLRNYAGTVWPRTTTFGKVTHVGSGVFLRGQSRSISKVPRAPAFPKFLDPCLRPHGLAQSDQVRYITRVQERAAFRWSIIPIKLGGGATASPKILQPLTRAHSMRSSNQILHGDQSRCEEIFYMVDHAPCPGQNFWWHECWRAISLR